MAAGGCAWAVLSRSAPGRYATALQQLIRERGPKAGWLQTEYVLPEPVSQQESEGTLGQEAPEDYNRLAAMGGEAEVGQAEERSP